MRVFLALLTAALIAALAAGSAASAEGKVSAVDIVGLRLGMTPEEAKAALLAHDPELMLQEQRMYFSYSDGEKSHKTEPFLATINARRRDALEVFTIELSPPPAGGKVVSIKRQQKFGSNAPTLRTYRDALVDKYGPPLPPDDRNLQGSSILVWEFPDGGIRCSPFGTGPSARERYIGEYLDMQFRAGGAQRDPSQCRSYVAYNIGIIGTADDTPTRNVSAYMVDIPAAIATFHASNEWVAGLKDAATQERVGRSSTAPKL